MDDFLEEFLEQFLEDVKTAHQEWDDNIKPLLSVLKDEPKLRQLVKDENGNFQTIVAPAWVSVISKLAGTSLAVSILGDFMIGLVQATYILGYQTRMAEELTFVVAEEEEK